MNKPLISVVLPVYNGAEYLREAISSILMQDISDIELIVINDASRDESDNIIREFTDRCITHISNPTNIGLASSLNHGIEVAKGTFVARMDQDDIANPNRLSLQLKSFIKNKNLGLCGTNFQIFRGNEIQYSKYPISHNKIFTNLLFYNCIAHPTVMFRRSVFVENDLFYDNTYDWAEDFELWTRARYFTEMLNIKRPLLKYRINTNSMTASGESKVHKTVNAVNKRSLLEIGIDAPDEILNLHLKIGHHMIDSNDTILVEKTQIHLWNILVNNQTRKIYNETDLKNAIATFWNPILLGMHEATRNDFLNNDLSQFLNSRRAIQMKLSNAYIKKALKKLIGRK